MSDQVTTSELIDDQIRKEVNKLDTLQFGSSDYAKAVEAIERLQKLNLKDSEIDVTYGLKDRELELRSKEVDLKSEELEEKSKEFEREMENKDRELDLKDRELENARERFEKEMRIKDEELDLKDAELKHREKELEESIKHNKRNFIAGLGLGIAGIVVPAVVHVGLSVKGFKFEETGTIGSTTFRNIMQGTNSFTRKMN